jgi:hypothetical protein
MDKKRFTSKEKSVLPPRIQNFIKGIDKYPSPKKQSATKDEPAKKSSFFMQKPNDSWDY